MQSPATGMNNSHIGQKKLHTNNEKIIAAKTLHPPMTGMGLD